MKQEIKHRLTGSVLFEMEAESLKLAVEAAVKSYSNLRDADLRGSDLSYSNLRYSNLRYSNLSGSNLRDADLRDADLRYSDLRYSDLRYSDLSYSNLRYSNLRYSNLRDADLSYSDLSYSDLSYSDLSYSDLSHSDLGKGTTKINWQSHDLVAEILRRAAGEDIEKLKIAGLLLVCRHWCWDQFIAIDDPLKEWAFGELREWVVDGDGSPETLKREAVIA